VNKLNIFALIFFY